MKERRNLGAKSPIPSAQVRLTNAEIKKMEFMKRKLSQDKDAVDKEAEKQNTY
jgi:hypothetical protein